MPPRDISNVKNENGCNKNVLMRPVPNRDRVDSRALPGVCRPDCDRRP
ncbi:hypothetical protein DM75_3971 [Burkholderia mallei]|nr:hypothetical protein DM75_3971 [Burkholderia mallei]